MGMQASKKCISILGAGTQGRRLAFMWSKKGDDVNLIDRDERQLKDAIAYIDGLKAEHSSEDAVRGSVHVHRLEDADKPLSTSWMVLECVPENLKLKRDLIVDLDAKLHPDTIIASNSSSYTINEIIKDAQIKHPDRAVSMHSYWPPESCALEIMGSSSTKRSIIDTLMHESKLHGFRPVHVKNESVGYVYNRIWAAIKREVLLELSEGVATPAEIDAIFKDILNAPKGPCEQMDVVGLDVVLDIEEHYADVRGNIPTAPREYLKDFIAKRGRGVKDKKGFYEY